MNTVTFSRDTKLYQIAYNAAYRLRQWIISQNLPIPAGIPEEPMERGSYLKDLEIIAIKHYKETGARCGAELHPLLIGHEGERARYTDENGKRKSFIVGISAGWMPCHIRLPRKNSRGGVFIHNSERFPNLTLERA